MYSKYDKTNHSVYKLTYHLCGSINSVLTCDNREWVCVNCQSVLDRDINAAINILNRWDDGDCLSSRS